MHHTIYTCHAVPFKMSCVYSVVCVFLRCSEKPFCLLVMTHTQVNMLMDISKCRYRRNCSSNDMKFMLFVRDGF
jgi:hypothetical protein